MNFSRPTHWWRELPKELDPYNITQWQLFAASRIDTRTNGWPLMDDFRIVLAICFAYVLLIVFGPAVFGRLLKKPLDVRLPMIGYNVVVIILNLSLFLGFVRLVITRRYNLVCNTVDYNDNLSLYLVYGYFISKGIDFTDTVFMLLRKKFDQASFLHVYHHCSMFLIWWVGARFVGGGTSVVGPMINCFVHVCMYSWYLTAALKIPVPLWLKKWITRVQIGQLFFVMVYSVVVAENDCQFPSALLYAQALFLGSLFLLFVRFYLRAYSKNKENGGNRDKEE